MVPIGQQFFMDQSYLQQRRNQPSGGARERRPHSHVTSGPLVDIDKAPTLALTDADLPKHIVPDAKAGPLHFPITNIVEPKAANGLPLVPFFSLSHQRYQVHFDLLSSKTLEKHLEQRKSNGPHSDIRAPGIQTSRSQPADQCPRRLDSKCRRTSR
jgi:uncharacterized protein DUF4986